MKTRHCFETVAFLLFLSCQVSHLPAAEDAGVDAGRPVQPQAADLQWMTDYAAAYTQAKSDGKMLLIHFVQEPPLEAGQIFQQKTLQDETVRRCCRDFVLLRLPTSLELTVAEQQVKLLEHGAFSAMNGRPGLAIVDLKHQERECYTHTVSCLPFEKPAYFAPDYWGVKSVKHLLQLPPGTLTQRTMVYAVRCHPENPRSTEGRFEPAIASACHGHSVYQARTGTLGHQNFGARYQRLSSQLGLSSLSEVCAMSWRGESLVAACFSCVDSWRSSPGHWSSVSAAQAAYGYDIHRGAGDTWYGTGIFAKN